MLVFDILKIMNSDVSPENAKIHLATSNGQDNPIDVYLADKFYEWQRWQAKKNFERKYVISLISMPGAHRWLYAGVHLSNTPKWIQEHKLWYYRLKEDSLCTELNGRMIVHFERPGRQSYLNATNWAQKLILSEVLPEQLSIKEFPGFKAINLSKTELDVLIKKSPDSWRSALANVAGIYLISDMQTGGLYVGSAYGVGGIWQRWQHYSTNGHGGNVELKELLKSTADGGRANSFRFSVLEIADTHASKEDILNRESHWKNVLLSRAHGLNSN